MEMRLDKAITLAGYTRSEAKAMIAKGRVCVNGIPVRDCGMNVMPEVVTFDGKTLETEPEIYLMMHKPAGVITATEDKSLPTVMDLLPEAYRRRKIGPVGRLDRDVTGLVLLTTNGQLAHRLISPKWKAEKTYRAECTGCLDENDRSAFAAGLALSDFTAQSAKLTILSSGETSIADVTITEGKYHQVKRMFAAIGHPLLRLKRLSIGCIVLDEALAEGEFRKLTAEEISGLLKLSNMESL